MSNLLDLDNDNQEYLQLRKKNNIQKIKELRNKDIQNIYNQKNNKLEELLDNDELKNELQKIIMKKDNNLNKKINEFKNNREQDINNNKFNNISKKDLFDYLINHKNLDLYNNDNDDNLLFEKVNNNDLSYIDDDINKYNINDIPKIQNEKQYTNDLCISILTKILLSINHLNEIHKYLKINILDHNNNNINIELEFDKLTYIKQDYIYNKIINFINTNNNNYYILTKNIKINIVSIINGKFL